MDCTSLHYIAQVRISLYLSDSPPLKLKGLGKWFIVLNVIGYLVEV